jgi:Transposase DNA-binding/Transposase DDE domain
MRSTCSWAAEEFGEAKLGDKRRTRRLVALAAEVAWAPAGTVTRACSSSASREGAFRLLENPAVGPNAIRRCVQAATVRRCPQSQPVIVAVDGTSLRITDKGRTKGIGPIGSLHRGAQGVQVMTAFAVTPDGAPLGIAAQKMWVRSGRSKRSGNGAPAKGGENTHWLDVLEECRQTFESAQSQATPWYQLDRGGDCWQVLTHAEQAGILLTVRAVHDRRVDDSAERLVETVNAAPVIAKKWLDVPARPATTRKRRIGKRRFHERIPQRTQRRAKVAIRATTVSLVVSTPKGTTLVPFNAVLVQEVKRAKVPVEWLLLTTHSIDTPVDVLKVVQGYALRWRVEDFHRAWKRGLCCVENTQLRSRDAIYRWATLLASVATRAMRLTHQARATPNAPATSEFSKLELKALIALRRPEDPDHRILTLAEAIRWVAELGGYTGPWNGPPGATTVGRGLDKVLAVARALEYIAEKR